MARRQHAGISDQWKASVHRLEDADALLGARRWRGAMYLAGYAVECRLKWKLMQRWRCRTLQEVEDRLSRHRVTQSPYTHNLALLVELCEGAARLRQHRRLWNTFTVLNAWRPAWRYNPRTVKADEAERFLTGIKEFLHWIDNNL